MESCCYRPGVEIRRENLYLPAPESRACPAHTRFLAEATHIAIPGSCHIPSLIHLASPSHSSTPPRATPDAPPTGSPHPIPRQAAFYWNTPQTNLNSQSAATCNRLPLPPTDSVSSRRYSDTIPKMTLFPSQRPNDKLPSHLSPPPRSPPS